MARAMEREPMPTPPLHHARERDGKAQARMRNLTADSAMFLSSAMGEMMHSVI